MNKVVFLRKKDIKTRNNNGKEENVQSSDVLLVGKVESLVMGETKTGKKMATLTLEGEGQVMDEDLGVMVDNPDGDKPVVIRFLDQPETSKFKATPAASRIERMKPGQGSIVLVKAEMQEVLDEDGMVVSVSYWGSRMVYPGSVLSYKTNDYGPGICAIFGRAVFSNPQNEGDESTLSVPVNIYSGEEWATYWAEMSEGDGLSAETRNDLAKADGKCPLVVFSVLPKEYKEEKENGIIKKVTAKFVSYEKIA